MKFILNEKYMLKERFFLLEADNPDAVKILAELSQAINNSKQSIDNFINNLTTLTEKDPPSSNVNEIKKLISSLKTIAENKELSDILSKENKAIKDKSLLKMITDINKSFAILVDAISDLDAKLTNDISSVETTDYNSITKTAEDLISKIDAFADGKAQLLASKKAKKDSRSKTDTWEAKFNYALTPEEKEKVWLEFYATTFGKENVDQIRKLNQGTGAFTSECLEMGFDANENPFIYFLKNNKNLLKLLNAFSYGALHNAFVRDYVTDAMLRGKGTLSTDNVIFSKSLYSDHYDDLLEYLRLQSEALNYLKNKTFITATLTKRYTDKPNDFIIDLFYAPGNTLAVERQAGNIKGKLKSLLQIRKELEGCFGISVEAQAKANQKEKLTDSALQVILTKLNKNKTDAIALIRYAYEKLRDANNVSSLQKIISEYPEIASADINESDIKRVGGLIANYVIRPGKEFSDFVNAIAKDVGIKGGTK